MVGKVLFRSVVIAAFLLTVTASHIVGAYTVSKAIRLTEYFRATATKVRKIITEQAMRGMWGVCVPCSICPYPD